MKRSSFVLSDTFSSLYKGIENKGIEVSNGELYAPVADSSVTVEGPMDGD